jgi:hypothetical protein
MNKPKGCTCKWKMVSGMLSIIYNKKCPVHAQRS